MSTTSFTFKQSFLGLLGAFMGLLLGSFLWIALGFANIITSFAGYAMIYAALKGFKMLSGQESQRWHLVVIVIAALIMIFIAEHLSLVFSIMNYGNLPFAPALGFANVYLIMRPLAYLQDVGFSLLLGYAFFALGTFRLLASSFNTQSPTSIEEN